jgi:DNA helicase-4
MNEYAEFSSRRSDLILLLNRIAQRNSPNVGIASLRSALGFKNPLSEAKSNPWAEVERAPQRRDAKHLWTPGSIGSFLFTSSPWTISLRDDRITVVVNGATVVDDDISPFTSVSCTEGAIWASLVLTPDESALPIRLDGLTNFDAQDLANRVADLAKDSALAVIQHVSDTHGANISTWAAGFHERARQCFQSSGKLGEPFCSSEQRPSFHAAVHTLAALPNVRALLNQLKPEIRDAFLLIWDLTLASDYLEEQLKHSLRAHALASQYHAWHSGLIERARAFFASHSHLSKEYRLREDAAFGLRALSLNSKDAIRACLETRSEPSEEVFNALHFAQLFDEQLTIARDSVLIEAIASARVALKTSIGTSFTDEQLLAVVNCPPRQRVIASAGSGKTSVVVAKVVHSVKKGLAPASRVLVLAFNKSAAEEIRSRIDAASAKSKIDLSMIRVDTFHKFGLDIIGEATGSKPHISKDIEQGKDHALVASCIQALCAKDSRFARQWALFTAVFSRPFFAEEPDASRRPDAFRTLRGESVKSREEVRIANWLHFNRVNYRYEEPYVVETADSQHSHYHPDFFYPDANAWHEHFAIAQDGTSPFGAPYLSAVEWKRALHAENGTTLFETTSHGLSADRDFVRLGEFLAERGALGKAPAAIEPIPTSISDTVTTIRTLIAQSKSTDFSADAFRSRISKAGPDRFRNGLLIDIFEAVLAEWNRRLADAGAIDFDDMVLLAAKHVETNGNLRRFNLVIVDEFQDVSASRARLLRALSLDPHARLCVVGDDWQAINRFAGADSIYLRQFDAHLGTCDTSMLTHTFRCKQDLCDASSHFVSKNPHQIEKVVRGRRSTKHPSVESVFADNAGAMKSAAADIIHWHANNGLRGGGESIGSVLVLCRYRATAASVESILPQRLPFALSCKTIHASKGLEADVVLVLDLQTDHFPSPKQSDPVLEIALGDTEAFLFAEERRLFYVAMTRAREKLILVSPKNAVSPFVHELIKDGFVAPVDMSGAPVEYRACKSCSTGVMVARTDQNGGSFLGCSRYPTCRATVQPQGPVHNRSVKRSPKGPM